MFAIGQRWICDAELDLGLGTVLTVEHRTVTIVFLASGETRTYSQQTAPLRRVLFSVGDQVESHEGWTLKISEIHEEDGVLTYLGKDESGKLRALNEGNLSNAIQLNRPLDRMLSGQVDANKWFELRNQALAHKVNLQNSNLIGLSDSRTSLIPHQLYIAHEVAKRFAPRVLLADEVGLGKTIEACLIMQHQLISGRAKRILIIVPEALLHQWLVELLRRFNLSFSILDAERCEAITESSEFENPFHAEQHVLCTMETLTQNSERLTHAIAGEWDLVIIDEAHHLEWSEDKVSVEYQAAEALAKSCKGLLLLTATPEQLGKAGHFARLRLLDPQRFHSYRDFLEEEKHYQQVASAIQSIVDESVLDQTTRERLEDWLATSESDEQMVELKQLLAHEGELDESHKTKIVNLLLDRHGTGRVLYRNTRNTVKGFPQRIVNLHPLPMPEQYGQLYVTAQRYEKEEDSILLAPERLWRHINNIESGFVDSETPIDWLAFDTRASHLLTFLQENKAQKVLIICASGTTAMELEKFLRHKEGLRVSAFHERLTIMERDRAASYFADMENGAQALICSEIGSEGRNFQFAHNLYLFDLPLNPDLLEQRIGRLDRIGQRKDIQLHVPYFENSPQEVIVRWYQEGLSAFERTCQIGEAVFNSVEPMLSQLIQEVDSTKENVDALIDSSKRLADEFRDQLEKGRDRLLELNSYNKDQAEDLQYELDQIDRNPELQDFMETVFDYYGLEIEDFRQNSFLIRPGPKVPTTLFSDIDEDGRVVTYNRNTALANEDMQFISWNHPYTRDALDFILSSEQGNTSLLAIKTNKFPKASILVETNYSFETVFPEAKHAGFGLRLKNKNYLLGPGGELLDESFAEQLFSSAKTHVDKQTAHTIVKSKTDEIKALSKKADLLAETALEQNIALNKASLTEQVQSELERLTALRKVNPNIRQEEIDYFRALLEIIDKRLSESKVRLDSIRVIMTH